METYLLMTYVTLEQEVAIRQLFFSQGWQYCKQDLSKTTEEVGPTCSTVPGQQTTCTRKRGSLRKDTSVNLQHATACKRNKISTSQSVSDYSVEEPTTSSSTVLNDSSNDFTIPLILSVESEPSDTSYSSPAKSAGSIQSASLPSNVYKHDKPKTDPVKTDDSNIANAEAEDTDTFDNIIVKVETDDPYFSSQQEGCQKNQTMNDSDRVSSENKSQHVHSNAAVHNRGGLRDVDISEEALRGELCETRGRRFQSKSSLSKHHKDSHDIKKVSCDQCGKLFSQKSSLLDHMVVHKDARSKICAVCGKSFKHRQSLARHAEEHEERKEDLKCTTCHKIFFRRDSLAHHMKTHRAKETCDQCNKQVIHLKLHQKTCNKERQNSHVCDVCGRKFLEKRYLQEHQRCLHSFEGRYSCNRCNSKFFHRASLFNHKLKCGSDNS